MLFLKQIELEEVMSPKMFVLQIISIYTTVLKIKFELLENKTASQV